MAAEVTNVYLLRHAETATPHVFHGAESDEVLSATGHATAALAAEWFATMNIDVVITSAMTRALQTAAPFIAKTSTPHEVVSELHERRVGILGGTPFTLVEGLWVDTLAAWTSGNTAFTTDGAESYDDVRTRVVTAFERVVSAHRGKTILMIVHGIVVKVLLLSLLQNHGPQRWHELGKVANLATTHLVSVTGVDWSLRTLFELPPGVATYIETATATQVAKSVA